jgi:small-conductance mechanosensitive channel
MVRRAFRDPPPCRRSDFCDAIDFQSGFISCYDDNGIFERPEEDRTMGTGRGEIQIFLTIFIVALLMIFRIFINRIIQRHASRYQLSEARVVYIRNILTAFLGLVGAVAIAAVLEVSIEGLSIYFASFFTVVGIAFFASWSILSNVTASVILFFTYPFQIGNRVRIIDGDNSIEGEVKNISPFNLKIMTGEGHLIFYPNNLAIQKPIMRIEAGDRKLLPAHGNREGQDKPAGTTREF